MLLGSRTFQDRLQAAYRPRMFESGRFGQPENPLRLQYLFEASLVHDQRGTVDLYEVSALEISEEAGDGFQGQTNCLADFFVGQSQRRMGPGSRSVLIFPCSVVKSSKNRANFSDALPERPRYRNSW